MAISIKTAYNNILSERYDKNNVYIYFGALFIFGIISAFGALFKIIAFISGISYLAVPIITNGVFAVGANNRYRGKKSVFPSLINEIEEIGEIGFKTFVGYIGNILIFGLGITIICAIFFAIFKPLGYVILTILLFLLFILITALQSLFMRKYEIKEWFNYKKAYQLLQNKYKDILMYALQIVAIGIITGIIYALISGIVTGIFNPIKHKFLVTLISSVVFGLINGVVTLFAIDLLGQLLRTIMPLKHRPTTPNGLPNHPQINGHEQNINTQNRETNTDI